LQTQHIAQTSNLQSANSVHNSNMQQFAVTQIKPTYNLPDNRNHSFIDDMDRFNDITSVYLIHQQSGVKRRSTHSWDGKPLPRQLILQSSYNCPHPVILKIPWSGPWLGSTPESNGLLWDIPPLKKVH